MTTTHSDILILGAGIAGYEAYRTLAKKLKKQGIKKTITIVDKNNYFTFTPLLHEVASGAVLPSHASFAVRKVLRSPDHTFVRDTVTHIDPASKTVTLSSGTITYDTCVVALGSISNLFNVPGADAHTYRVRSLVQAVALQHAVADHLEEPGRQTLSINIIGGGYTGVEIAAEFAELCKEELTELYPTVDISVHIVQAMDKLVPFLPTKARKLIEKRLRKLGVEIHLNARATEVTEDTVILGEAGTLPNDITIWVTGFTTEAPRIFDEQYVQRARVPVGEHLQLEGHPDTYVIGDMALISDPTNGDITYPQLGEAAHHAGLYTADHIVRKLKGASTKPFHFKSKGHLIPVGEWYAIGIFGGRVFHGRFIWWLRRTAYILFIPGMLRKVRIVIDWTLVSRSMRHIARTNSSK